ncbi:MAG: DUF4846 domain-containing protein [Bacteroidia bacterium]
MKQKSFIMKCRLFLLITIFFLINAIAFAFHQIIQHRKSCIDVNGKTVATRIHAPEGFHIVNADKNSYAAWLQNCTVKPNGYKVHLYNGSIKQPDNIYDAVLDVDVGDKDLQQCADAVIRLRAEYLFATKQFAKIHFNLTNGDRVDYNKYAEGFRPVVHGNKISWNKNSASDYSYSTFRKYFDFIFNYAEHFH